AKRLQRQGRPQIFPRPSPLPFRNKPASHKPHLPVTLPLNQSLATTPPSRRPVKPRNLIAQLLFKNPPDRMGRLEPLPPQPIRRDRRARVKAEALPRLHKVIEWPKRALK